MEEHLFDTIRAYFRQELPEAERRRFELRLKEDKDFAVQVTELVALFQAVQAEGDRELNERLNQLSAEIRQQESPDSTAKIHRIRPYRRLLYAAAIVACLLAAFPLWRMLQSNGSVHATPDQLFASNFNVPGVSMTRDDGQEFWRARLAAGDYVSTIHLLDSLLAIPEFTSRSQANFYLGVAQLGTGNAGQALDALDRVSPESYDWESAQWYRALAFLKLHRVAEAKTLFTQIARQAGHPWQANATQLLADLQKVPD